MTARKKALGDAALLCPICGFALDFPPWEGDCASFEICPCCGIQYGYTDFAGGSLEKRQQLYEQRREAWIRDGMKWLGVNPPPKDWNPAMQLARLGQLLA